MDISAQQQFYNEYWKGTGYINSLKLQRTIAILEAIQQVQIQSPKIIELGCGYGWLTAILGLVGPSTGVELSDVAVRRASESFPHVTFIQADLVEWSNPVDDRYDIVVSHEVIEHMEDQIQHLKLAYSLLKPDGRLILTTPNAQTFQAMPDDQRKAWAAQPIESWLTGQELAILLKAVGFTNFTIRSIIPNYGIKGPYRIFSSKKLKHAFQRVGLGEAFAWLRLRLGFGLHLIAIAGY